MGKLRLDEQATPATPPTGFAEVFVDSADKKAKQIDDAGLVIDLTSGNASLTYIVDELYGIDTTRGDKKLGISLVQQTFGRNNPNVTDQYLRGVNGLPSNLSSHHLPYDATLVAIEMTGERNDQTWTAEVRRNGSATIEDSLQIVNVFINADITKDLDFDSGDIVQVFMTGTGIARPHVTLYFRRRTA